MPSETPRIPPLPDSEQGDFLRRVLENTGPTTNIFATLARHPELFERWIRFASYFLSDGRLSERDRELAILRTAYNCASPYERAQHARLALAAGITQGEIDALERPADEHQWSASERVLIEATDELHRSSSLSDETWATLREFYDDERTIELIMLVGHYHMVAYALNSLRVQVEDA